MMRGERILEHELVVADLDCGAVVGRAHGAGASAAGRIGRQPLCEAEDQNRGRQ